MVRKLRFFVIAGSFIGLWQLVCSLGDYPRALLPTPYAVFKTFGTELISGDLFKSIIYSLLILGKGLFWAVLLASVLLIISRLKPWGEDTVQFLTTIAHPLPGIAILPLVILWAGIGEQAILFIVVHSMLWPLLITLKERLETLIHQYERLGQAFNLTKLSRTIHIYVMGAVPSLITGIKIAWSRGWRAFISAEMVFGIVGQKSGLGWYLFEQRVYMNSEGLFAGLMAILICGVLIEQLVFQPLELSINERWRA